MADRPAPAPIPEGHCLLHIGPYKTGSTAIQAALHTTREALRDHGVVYPGTGSRAMRAGWAVIGVTPRGRPEATIDEWHRLVREVHEAGPHRRTCVSTEDFGRVGPEIAARVAGDLGRDRVHVLTFVRRLDRLLPSQWQQRAQSFKTDTWEEYLHAVLDAEPATQSQSRAAFWASHDVGRLLSCWSGVVGPERVIAVVSDESDRRLLPRTFEQLLDLPEGFLELPSGRNSSLTANQVELLRRLNVAAREREWPDAVYARLYRSMIAEMRNVERTPVDRPTPGLPAWAVDRVEELSAARVEALRSSGVVVVGDVELLRTVESAAEEPEEVDVLGLEAMARGLAGAVGGFHTLAQRQRRTPPEGGPAPQPAGRPVEETPARELLAVAGRRVAARLGRRHRVR